MSPILVRPSANSSSTTASFACFRRRAGASSTSGSIPERAERAGRHRPGGGLSRPGAVVAGARPRLQAVVEVETGESVNHLEALAEWAHFAQAAGAVSPVRAVRHGRCRPPALRGQPDRRQRDLELPHASATKSGSRSCTGRAKRPPRRRSRARQPAPRRKPRSAAVKRAAARGKARGKAPGQESGAAAAEAKIARAVRPVLPRQARLRAHLPRSIRSQGSRGRLARPLLVSDAARRQGRPRPVRRERPALARGRTPDVQFDWEQIVATPMPPPAPVEHWRERRRAERAAKQARAAEDEETAEPDVATTVAEHDLAAAERARRSWRDRLSSDVDPDELGTMRNQVMRATAAVARIPKGRRLPAAHAFADPPRPLCRAPTAAASPPPQRRGRRAERPGEADATGRVRTDALDPPTCARRTVKRRVAAAPRARGIIVLL